MRKCANAGVRQGFGSHLFGKCFLQMTKMFKGRKNKMEGHSLDMSGIFYGSPVTCLVNGWTNIFSDDVTIPKRFICTNMNGFCVCDILKLDIAFLM